MNVVVSYLIEMEEEEKKKKKHISTCRWLGGRQQGWGRRLRELMRALHLLLAVLARSLNELLSHHRVKSIHLLLNKRRERNLNQPSLNLCMTLLLY